MDFERWLERELQSRFEDSAARPVPSPRYPAPQARRNVVLKTFAALAGSKLALAGTAAVALAATGVGVASDPERSRQRELAESPDPEGAPDATGAPHPALNRQKSGGLA